MFEAKRVLITGSSRGIGLAAADAFLKEGAHVAINEPVEDVVHDVVSRRTEAGLKAYPAPGSVATAQGCEEIVDAAVRQMGGLDILVNSAGIYRQGPAETFDEDEWDRTLDINLKGTFFSTVKALPFLRAGLGNVVNLASEAGLRGAKLSAVYCASKGGVVLLTKALALEYAPHVRVNCVCPGAVETDMMNTVAEASGDRDLYMSRMAQSYPLERIATPGEIAHAILYLASDNARNVTGAALAIDGGSTAGR